MDSQVEALVADVQRLNDEESRFRAALAAAHDLVYVAGRDFQLAATAADVARKKLADALHVGDSYTFDTESGNYVKR